MDDAAVRVTHVEAIVGADPEPIARVGIQRIHGARTQAVRVLGVVVDMQETAVRLQAIEATEIGTDPDPAGSIFGKRKQIVAAEGADFVGLMPPMREALAVRFESVEARCLAAAPEIAGAVDQQRRDIVRSQRGRIGRIVAKQPKADAIVTGEPVLGANPDEAIPILHGLVDDAGRKSIGNRHRHELRRRQRRPRRCHGDQHEQWQCQQSAHAILPCADTAMWGGMR